MREIRQSGLKRAEEAESLPLRYSTAEGDFDPEQIGFVPVRQA
jgi:hypothetical protein